MSSSCVVEALDLPDNQKKYITDKVDPVLHEMMSNILMRMPSDPVAFMIDWLKKEAGQKAVDEDEASLSNLLKQIQLISEMVCYLMVAEHDRRNRKQIEHGVVAAPAGPGNHAEASNTAHEKQMQQQMHSSEKQLTHIQEELKAKHTESEAFRSFSSDSQGRERIAEVNELEKRINELEQQVELRDAMHAAKLSELDQLQSHLQESRQEAERVKRENQQLRGQLIRSGGTISNMNNREQISQEAVEEKVLGKSLATVQEKVEHAEEKTFEKKFERRMSNLKEDFESLQKERELLQNQLQEPTH